MSKAPTAILFIVSMTIAMSFVVIRVSGETYVHRSYQWQYDGLTWTWSIDIPLSLYNGYASVSEFNRLFGRTNGYLVTTGDPFIQSIANAFREAAQKQAYGAYDEASLVLAWVQSLPYTSDSVTSPYDEFPRFPVETLYANGGDCEDTTYLYLTIMRIWGYGSIFINPESHLAAGILGSNDLPGYYWEYDDRRYYYAETTGDGWRIGDIPDQFRGNARLYPITVEGFVPNWSGTTTTQDPDTTPNQNQPNQPDQPGIVSRILSEMTPYVWIFGVVLVISVVAVAWEENRKRKLAMTQPQPVALNCSFCGEPMNPQAVYCSRCGKARVESLT